MKRILCLSALFCLIACAAVRAQGVGEANHLFYRANSAYKEGKFDAAIADYKSILGQGFESGNIYYNLGNSYFKKDDLGEAVFYYELALALMPGDSDLRSNYEYALSSLGIAREYFGNRFQRFCARLFDGVTADLLAVFLFVLYALIVVMLILKLYFNWAGIVVKTVVPLFAGIMIISATAFYSKITFLNRGAIVVKGPAEVKFEPQNAATTYFKLGPGSRVEILGRAADWAKVRRPDGKIGWVSELNLKRVTS